MTTHDDALGHGLAHDLKLDFFATSEGKTITLTVTAHDLDLDVDLSLDVKFDPNLTLGCTCP